nr:immunoglobulin light chain junction region [Macaca mulatta]MOV62930.1 immunoglobulin light chain junction region [Macaca mulatta]MOV63648.1 immunoglobulin light chain junction region [Macaca mulatta]MOV63827.1 immunoglobulin light chain junction region [Macaca mulatta]MOV64157.1 immunoglobulin light chain junction region [Macaca mulatta]
CQQHNNYPNTF